MKKLFVLLAFTGIVGAVSASSIATACCKSSVTCHEDKDKKCDEKKCKKGDKCCKKGDKASTSASADGKSSNPGSAGETKKGCCSSKSAKSCGSKSEASSTSATSTTPAPKAEEKK